MVQHGFLTLLADLGELEQYWKQWLLDFPQHPAHGQEASSIPLSLYGYWVLYKSMFYILCFSKILYIYKQMYINLVYSTLLKNEIWKTFL